MREEEAHWKAVELKTGVLAVLEEEKVLLREGLEVAAAAGLEEPKMARVMEARLRAEEVVVLQAVQERMLLEEAAVEEVPQREPVLKMPAVAEELKELGLPKLELVEGELEAA